MAVAVQMYEQVYVGSGRVLGPDHPDTLAVGVALAGAYYAVGRLTDAVTLYRDVVARGERVLPPGHPLTMSARDSMTAIAGE